MHHRMAVIGDGDVLKSQHLGGSDQLRRRGGAMVVRRGPERSRFYWTAHQTATHSSSNPSPATASRRAALQLSVVSAERKSCMA